MTGRAIIEVRISKNPTRLVGGERFGEGERGGMVKEEGWLEWRNGGRTWRRVKRGNG